MVFEDGLKIVQMIVSISLVVMVVLQGKGSGVGSMLGGTEGVGITKTRRGLEKTMFQVTVGLAVIFIVNAIILLLIQ